VAKTDKPHRRHNLLTGEWVLVSPHRAERPWLGEKEKLPQENHPPYVKDCYLCPGNERAGGARNPQYESTYIFTNDYAALLPGENLPDKNPNPLLGIQSANGTCRVICFSPRHNLTLAEMNAGDIKKVIDVWAEEIQELGKKYQWVQIFENKGEIMGCSNPHPHCQIWAGDFLPLESSKEDREQREYFLKNKTILLADYLKHELELGQRVVAQNEHWAVLVPFWAVWPFETLLVPKRHVKRMPDLTENEREALSQILKNQLTKYDNLFNASFPYTMGWHGAPTDKKDYSHWQLHAHYYPPLLRSATVKKFMVGYEMLGEPQRDITAEQAAEQLRQTKDKHHKA